MEFDMEIPSVCRACLRERAKVVIIPDAEEQSKHMKQMHKLDPLDPADFFNSFSNVWEEYHEEPERDILGEVIIEIMVKSGESR